MANDGYHFNLYGGATRPDAISGLSPEFRDLLIQMIQSAPPEIGKRLGIGSGYRSIERQRELFEASDKSGKTVARPGYSQHNHGRAVDLYGDGVRLDKAPPELRDWVHANAQNYGLTFPMDYESWHVEPVGARNKGQSAPITVASGAPAPALPPAQEIKPNLATPIQENPQAPQQAPMTAQSAPQKDEGSPLGQLFANLAPVATQMSDNTQQMAPSRIVFGDGGAGSAMAAQNGALGAQQANQLVGQLRPNIDEFLSLGGRKRTV